MCQCDAEEALTLEVSKFVYPVEPGACVPQTCGGTVRDVRPLTHDVIAFALELERPRDFDAGQFVLLAPQEVTGYRAYSMCNYERGARRLEFLVKKKPDGGFSQWLFGADRDGARLAVFGPLGKATFEPGLGKNLLCIAGGSGIAGMMSILARADAADYFSRHQGHVFFGIRTMKDAFFLDELSKTKAAVTVALSDQEVPDNATRAWPTLEIPARPGARGGEARNGGQVPERARLPRRPAAGGGRGDPGAAARRQAHHRQHPLRQIQLMAAKRMVCRVGDVPENGLRECEAEGGLKLVVANAGGEFFGFQAICPHQEVPLCEGMFDGATLTCHMHLWQWDVRTGEPLGIAEAPLQRYPIAREGDALYLAAENTALEVGELFNGLPGATLEKLLGLAKKETPCGRRGAVPSRATRRRISSCSIPGASNSCWAAGTMPRPPASC